MKTQGTLTTSRRIALLVCVGFFLIAAGLSILWHSHPSLAPCLAFWVASIVCISALLYGARNYGHVFTAIGLLCNATVTLANDGQMPVLVPLTIKGSVWVVANPTHRLLILADRFWIGLSVGDLLLAVGILASFIVIFSREKP